MEWNITSDKKKCLGLVTFTSNIHIFIRATSRISLVVTFTFQKVDGLIINVHNALFYPSLKDLYLPFFSQFIGSNFYKTMITNHITKNVK